MKGEIYETEIPDGGYSGEVVRVEWKNSKAVLMPLNRNGR